MAALVFWIRGNRPPLYIRAEAEQEGFATEDLALDALADVQDGVWTEVVVPLAEHGEHAWTRVNFVDAGAGVEFWIDDVVLVDLATGGGTNTEGFVSVEPVAPDRLLLLGDGTPDGVVVRNNGKTIPWSGEQIADDPPRVYLYLEAPISKGSLEVKFPDGSSFVRVIRGRQVSVSNKPSHAISPLIYGMAFAEGGTYNVKHGVTNVRWGGNAMSMYNPFELATNRAKDWYFENSAEIDAREWVKSVHGSGGVAQLSIPIMDWVARDQTSYAYSVEKYGWQQSTDPWKPDAGNGKTPEGHKITGNDPHDHATPWSEQLATEWLHSFDELPEIVLIGNELDIAAQTHHDIHPEPVTYAEQRDEYLK